jgi:hypothetical protein
MPESLRVVVPSRRRVKNIPTILSLLPDAVICVAESERADYAAAVPRKQLLCHRDLPGLIAIRNWLNDTIQEDCIVQIDDDLKGIRPLIGKNRRQTDPDVIDQVIRNQHQVAQDLDISVFCWSRTRNTPMAQPQFQPFRVVGPVSSSFGLRGSARNRRFDPEIPGRADVDFTMQTLLKDRIVLMDMRWHFDHGRVFSGKGGNVGLLSDEDFERATRILYARWGRHLGRSKPGFVRKSTSRPLSIKVQRRSDLA